MSARSIAALLASSLAFVHASGQTSVFDVVAASPEHTLLEGYLRQTGLDEVLDDAEGTYTLFAPTDEAFEALPTETLEELSGDEAALGALLRYHVLGTAISTGAIAEGQSYVNSLHTVVYQDSALGLSIQLVKDDAVELNGAIGVSTADVAADNGVVHFITGVLMPLSLTGAVDVSPSHATLASLFAEAELAGAIESVSVPLTLYAPTDAAFAALPAETLDDLRAGEMLDATLVNHLVFGALPSFALESETAYAFPVPTANGFASQLYSIQGQLGFKDIDYEPTDVVTRNGILQVLPAVATLPSITDFVAFSFQHTALEFLLDTAGLTQTIDELEQLTLFAPFDEAIVALGNEALGALVADERRLRELLLYHVFPQAAPAEAFPRGLSFFPSAAAYSLQFQSFGTAETFDSLLVDGQALLTADLRTTDGFVQIPAGLLTPPSVAGIAARSPAHETLAVALDQADLATTLADESARYTVFAPTDAAFEALGDTLADVLADPSGSLRQVLLYHVLGDSLGAQELADLAPGSPATLQGEPLEIGADPAAGVLTVNGATVLLANVIGTNGVVHVIDAVLTPDVISSVTDVLASEAGILVGPNPAHDFADVTFGAELAHRLDLTLYDAAGAEVLRANAVPGTARLNLGGVHPGTYFLLLRGGGATYYQPLLVR